MANFETCAPNDPKITEMFEAEAIPHTHQRLKFPSVSLYDERLSRKLRFLNSSYFNVENVKKYLKFKNHLSVLHIITY